MSKNIKEICIESYLGHFSRVHFEDELKISANRVSYKKRVFDQGANESREDVKWDYKTTSKEFSALFDALCFDCLYYSKKDKNYVLDVGGYSIAIKRFDNSKTDYHFDYVGFVS